MKLDKLIELSIGSEQDNLDLLAASCRVATQSPNEVQVIDEEE